MSSLFPTSATRPWQSRISAALKDLNPNSPNSENAPKPLIQSTNASNFPSGTPLRTTISTNAHEDFSGSSGSVPSASHSTESPLELRRDHQEALDLPAIHLIGNLPFHVSTPLLLKWMRTISERRSAWRYGRVPFTITLQAEVAERLIAPPLPFAPLSESKSGESNGGDIDARIGGKGTSDKRRSRISVMVQNFCHVSFVSTIQGTRESSI